MNPGKRLTTPGTLTGQKKPKIVGCASVIFREAESTGHHLQ
jgi:hypothetical protein